MLLAALGGIWLDTEKPRHAGLVLALSFLNEPASPLLRQLERFHINDGRCLSNARIRLSTASRKAAFRAATATEAIILVVNVVVATVVVTTENTRATATAATAACVVNIIVATAAATTTAAASTAPQVIQAATLGLTLEQTHLYGARVEAGDVKSHAPPVGVKD